MSSQEHDFSPEQAEAILKRAIDLQAEQPVVKSEVENHVSLAQLCRSATELGIDASHVRQAAEELNSRPRFRKKSDKTEPNLIEKLFQVEIKESDFPDLLEHLRAETKSPGAGQVIGGSLEWQAYSMARKELLHVAVIPSTGLTRVKIRSVNPFGAASKFFFIAPVGFILIGLGMALSLGPNFKWTDILPFLIPISLAGISVVFMSKRMPWSKRINGSESLMHSISVWMEELRSFQNESPTKP